MFLRPLFEEEEEEEEEDEPVFVLTDEWRDFFAKSEAKRKLGSLYLLNVLSLSHQFLATKFYFFDFKLILIIGLLLLMTEKKLAKKGKKH